MSSPATDPSRHIAASFVRARQQGVALPAYPGERPAGLAPAYRVQDHALAIDTRAVAGWKIGKIPSPEDDRLGINRLAGPIFAETLVWPAPGEAPEMPVYTGGFGAAEAEFLLHLAPGFTGPLPDTDAQTRALVDDVRLGIEIASSPYPGINADGPCVTISDYGNNNGLVLGATVEGWQDLDFDTVEVSTLIDGETAGQATTATMLDGPWGALRFLLGHLRARGVDVSEGLWASTGAVTGVHDVRPGQRVIARFAGLGEVACTIGAATPRN